MKKVTLLLTVLLSTMSLFAQHVTDYERIYYYEPAGIEEGDISISAKNAVAQADHSKFALTIQNNSDDYLLFKPMESTVHFEFGDKNPQDKPYFIKPNAKKTKTIKADGGNQFRQQKFSYEVGGMYIVPLDGDAVEAPEFQLPANKNSFTAGNFKVVLRKYDASTREAKAQFEVTYTGDKVGVVNGSNLSVKANHKKTGEELMYANDDKKSNVEILQKGDKAKFNAVFHIEGRIVDMQFAKMHIQWNDTFTETDMESVDAPTIEFEMSESLTKEKK